jgi:hypothetical protein
MAFTHSTGTVQETSPVDGATGPVDGTARATSVIDSKSGCSYLIIIHDDIHCLNLLPYLITIHKNLTLFTIILHYLIQIINDYLMIILTIICII